MKTVLTVALSLALVVALAPGASALIYQEDWDGSNGSWVKGDFVTPGSGEVTSGSIVGAGGAGHNAAGAQGWDNYGRQKAGNKLRIIGSPGNGANDRRQGIGTSNGVGNSWEGCPSSNPDLCGASRAVHTAGQPGIIFSSGMRVEGLALVSSSLNGVGGISIGDGTLRDDAGQNEYRLNVSTLGGTSLETVVNGNVTAAATLNDDYAAPGIHWFEGRIVVSNIGTGNQSAVAEWRNIEDNTGAPTGTGAWNALGSFPHGTFAVNRIAIFGSVNPGGGGAQYAPHFDNLYVDVPEPASLMLLGVGGLMMLRRKR